MAWTTEKDMRLFIIDRLGAKPKALADAYHQLEQPASDRKKRVAMDLAA
jgi:hypothetical protein